jgi:F-type H+/Na+-transporting ATPase subunit alpha
VEDVRRFEAEFLAHLRRTHETVLKEIVESKQLSEDGEKAIVEEVEDFKKQFTATDGSSVAPEEPDAAALAADEVGQETVKVHRPAPNSAGKK